MILAIKIIQHDLAYINDIKECLVHNSSNPEIERIVIFSESDLGIDVDSKSKKILIMKMDLSHFDAISYSCRQSKDCVVYSTPFVKFDSNLKILKIEAMKGVVFRSPDTYYVFRKGLKLENKSNLDEILGGSFEMPRFGFAKTGYFVSNMPASSFGWKISKGFFLPDPNMEAPVSVSAKKEISISPAVAKEPSKKIRIDVVIVSVDYNDLLEITLGHNRNIFDSITVVTSSSDKKCVEICEKMDAKVVVTDSMYSEGAEFNKGKAINEGISSLKDPEFVLLLDADIIVPDFDFSLPLEENTIYYRDRIMLRDYDSYERFKKGSLDFETESLGPIGYFQLFKYGRKLKYAESSSNAAWSDVRFIRKFRWQKKIGSPVIHLGEDRKNWSGRTTPDFKKAGGFDFNSYFDMIYCLNLDKRRDRWDKVKKEFRRFGISASRFSAIDGENMSHPESDRIESMSDRGLIENSSALGCLKSHIEMIKDAKSKGYNRILIFEDDVMISEDFHSRISLLSQMDWKIFYLGASQFDWNRIHIKEGYYRCRKTLGTFAYALDCSVYDEILEKAEGSEMSIDNILSAVQAENMKKCLTFFPNIVISDVSDSDIRDDKKLTEYSKLMRWNLGKFKNVSLNRLSKSISIIIPCYGHSAFLEECVYSCLSQTIQPSKILILCMDDESIEIGKRIQSENEIVEIVESEKMFLSKARNTCVKVINTDYFIPLDADDRLPDNFIEETSKIDADVVYVGSRYFGAMTGTWPEPIEEEIDWNNLTTFRRNSLVCTALIKREPFIKVGMYNESLWAFEDMDLWIRMHRHGIDFKKCFETFLHYRKHVNSKSLLGTANSNEQNRRLLKETIMKDEFYKRTPKIVHWVWIGDKPIPNEVVDTWKRNLGKGWKFIMWNEKNFDMNSCDFLKKAYALKKYGICVDYIRASVLYKFGGVWLDADCIINDDISPFLQYDFFGSWENESFINIGLIGCSPRLSIMKNIMLYYGSLKVSEEILNSHSNFVGKIGTGPIVLTNEISRINDIRNGGHASYFEHDGKRYLIDTPDVFVLDDSGSGRKNFAVHLFDGSWTEKKEEWSVVVRRSYDNWKIENKI